MGSPRATASGVRGAAPEENVQTIQADHLVLSSAVAFLVGIILAGGVTRTPVVSSEPASAAGVRQTRAADVARRRW